MAIHVDLGATQVSVLVFSEGCLHPLPQTGERHTTGKGEGKGT